MALLDDLLKKFERQEEEARAATTERETKIMAITDEIIARYSPGGVFEEKALAQLGQQKTEDVSAGMQQLIGSGLAGTEAGAHVGTAWEKAVGAPARLRLEDLMMERLSGAQMQQAGFMERITDQFPDWGMIAQLAMAVEQSRAAGGGGGTVYSYGPSVGSGFELTRRMEAGMPRYGGSGGYQPTTQYAPTAPYAISPETAKSGIQGRQPITQALPSIGQSIGSPTWQQNVMEAYQKEVDAANRAYSKRFYDAHMQAAQDILERAGISDPSGGQTLALMGYEPQYGPLK